jgi:hypothetical protein
MGLTKAIFVYTLIGILPTVGYAQMDSALLKRVSCFSLGIVAGVQGSDAGIGLEATSRPLLGKRLLLRVRGGLNWLESYKTQTSDNITYPSFAAAIVYQIPHAERARFYIETGPYGKGFMFTNGLRFYF